MPGKRVTIDDETWSVLDLLAKRTGRDFQDLVEEALGDLIAKHGEARGLAAQLRGSLDAAAAEVTPRKAQSRKR